MKSAVNDGQSTLFQVQLRLGSEIIPVRVLNSDDHSSLTSRVCRDHRIDSHYRQLIQNKILVALHNIVKGGRVEQSLSRKVQRFIDREAQLKHRLEEVQEAPSNSSNNSSVLHASNQQQSNTHKQYVSRRQRELFEKVLSEHNSQNSDHSRSSSSSRKYMNHKTQQNTLEAYIPSFGSRERRFGGELNNSQTKNVPLENLSTEKSRAKLPTTPNKGTHTVNRSTTGQLRTHEDYTLQESAQILTVKGKSQWKATGAPSQFDIDLLLAYRNVYEKCKNPPMKEMVKRIIEELEQKQRRHKPALNNLQYVNVKPFNETKHQIVEKKETTCNQPIAYPNNPINLFSFQELSLERQEKANEKSTPITLLNQPYLENSSSLTPSITNAYQQNNLEKYERKEAPKVDMRSLDNLLSRNQRLLEQTSPNNRRPVLPQPEVRDIPKSILNTKSVLQSTSKSPSKRVQFAEEKKEVHLLTGTQSPSIRNLPYHSPHQYLTRRSPPRRPDEIEDNRYISARQPTTFSLERAAKPTESLPMSMKNSAIKPSSVTCIHANPNNSRRFKYLEESDYCA